MKHIYYCCHFDEKLKKYGIVIEFDGVRVKSPPSVETVEKFLCETLHHGDIVNFDSDGYESAFFVREYYSTSNGPKRTKGWVANNDVAGRGYLTVPKEITSTMDDAMSEYSHLLFSDEPTILSAIYLSEDDKYIQNYPDIRRSQEHHWSHMGYDVIEGAEKPFQFLLTFDEGSPKLHLETRKSYIMTLA